jgi:cellulose synthase/poly-beta-1,6-N-acetylglucosamine synthase-like glycosyltransferase/peptidoglycan/xylan/chitin deacetylase (PgdA/CDA1 family)/spore germination protein YaaH
MAGNQTRPIFFDPQRKRWPRFRRGLFAAALIFTIVFGGLVASVLINPVLPALKLPQSLLLPRGGHLAPPVPDPPPTGAASRRFVEAKRRLEAQQRQRPELLRGRRAPAAGQPMSVGFFVNWDDSSMTSLRENVANLDVLIPEWLHLRDGNGTVVVDDLDRQQSVMRFVKERRPDLKVVPLINNFDGRDWQDKVLAAMVANPDARARVVSQLLDYVTRDRFPGVSIDFENVPAAAARPFTRFIQDLCAAFHAAHRTVWVNVPADDEGFDYRGISRDADYVIVMAYDQHWPAGSAGPIASLEWFDKAVRRRLRDTPPARTIVALGNYAYDWMPKTPAVERTFEEAVLTAKESEGAIHVDPASLNPMFTYADDDDKVHQVWMLDATTVFDQLAIVRTLGATGAALWRLGSEDPAIWTFFGRNVPLDAQAASALGSMRYGYDLDYEGDGEILGITSQPQPGTRTVTFDPASGFITGEQFTVFPSPYVLTRYGARDHQVALTFDDGPDPDVTPDILDILKQAKVPATFFIIGVNGEEYPDLLRREVAEGHELGNHTFTHPNIATIPPVQFRLELSATQRLFESVVGRQSHLFRPPYAEDAEPETPDQVRPLELARERGYITVGMKVDPGDWQRPGAPAIVQRTIDQLERHQGNIVLLHDGGGDRSETIEALPLLITQLRQRGYRFVAVSDLIGRTRDEVMPPLSATERWGAWTDRAAFGALWVAISALHWLFLGGIVLGAARLVFIGALAARQTWHARHAVFDPSYDPSVAVIVPAYNEAKVIVQTVTSLLACDHPGGFEIIVVDDGSTDDTVARLERAFAGNPKIRVLTQANAGKAHALNYGVARTSAEIVVALDADTVFARGTVRTLVRHFANPRIGAVAGNAKVGNRVNLLTRWQALEYITSQNLDRRAFDTLDCITVVPGAVGAWRRDVLERAGGFSPRTLAEDADLTFAIRRLGYSIAYEDQAIALTEAPDTLGGFIRQRYRWTYGTFQAAWKHKDALFRPRYGSLGFVALPNIFVFQVLFPLVSPVMDLLLVISLLAAAFGRWQHPAEFSADTLWRVLFYYAMFQAIDFLSALVAFVLEWRENFRLLVLLFWQRFFYRQIIYYVAVRAILSSLEGGAVEWDKLERKATVRI